MPDRLDEIMRDAEARGLFEDLPGHGEPIDLFEDPNVPPELRTLYRILKDNGIAPAEVQDLQHIARLETALLDVKDPARRARLRNEINVRRATVDLRIARMKERGY